VVPDVAAFQGRVGCDIVSKAEIAVPIFFDDRVAAVLDIDSSEIRGVDEVDRLALEQISGFVSSRTGRIGWPG
jgi:GAF domain-containing protein